MRIITAGRPKDRYRPSEPGTYRCHGCDCVFTVERTDPVEYEMRAAAFAMFVICPQSDCGARVPLGAQRVKDDQMRRVHQIGSILDQVPDPEPDRELSELRGEGL